MSSSFVLNRSEKVKGECVRLWVTQINIPYIIVVFIVCSLEISSSHRWLKKRSPSLDQKDHQPQHIRGTGGTLDQSGWRAVLSGPHSLLSPWRVGMKRNLSLNNFINAKLRTTERQSLQPAVQQQQKLMETTGEDLNLKGTSIQIVTRERNHLFVMFVTKDLLKRKIWRNTAESTEERNHLVVTFVVTDLHKSLKKHMEVH